ncbi:hypothetical protein LINPERHAP1_LOCUS37624 [Linum perenne]
MEENAEVKDEDGDLEILPPDFDTRPDSLPKSGKQSNFPGKSVKRESSKLSVKRSFRVDIRETHFKYRRLTLKLQVADYSKKQEWVLKACKWEGPRSDDPFLQF